MPLISSFLCYRYLQLVPKLNVQRPLDRPAYLSHGQRAEGSKLIDAVGVLKYYYIYSKESRDLTPCSESPVQAVQELNRDSRAESEPPKGTLVSRARPPVAEIMTVVC
jgi:hypothetical protein